MTISWHSKALSDLNQNIAYITKQSPQNALNVLTTLTELADSLANMPFKYPKEPIYDDDRIRFVSKWSFKIIYRVDEDSIYILRVFNTNQDPREITD